MSKIIFPSVFFVLIAASAPFVHAASNIAAPGKMGVGIELGYPFNGVSVNSFVTKTWSVQIDGAFWISDEWTSLGARVDALMWQDPLARFRNVNFLWYFGPGLNLFWHTHRKQNHDRNYIGLGGELPVGIAVQFHPVPIDLTLEGVPIVHLVGDNGLGMDVEMAGAFHARYYF